ncbi:uncharacterized protein [Malus domestica]|uniref:uncharacterized protein isoform X1 n=1 Tax=Malus domestica TaxID=3750 RepID=UPI003976072F
MKFALVAEWLPSLTSTTASLFAFPLSPNRILIFEQGNSKLENLLNVPFANLFLSNRCKAKSKNGYEHGIHAKISHLFIVVLMEHGIHITMHTNSRRVITKHLQIR